MLYNVMILGKRYRNKTKDYICNLVNKQIDNLAREYAGRVEYLKFEIDNLKDSTIRIAFFNNKHKVIFSVNKVKE